jgi:predicted metal-binding membrane protein
MLSGQKTNGDIGSLMMENVRGSRLAGALLIFITVLAWVAVVLQAMGMQAAPTDNVVVFLVAWGVMMTAMMLPSATPMIALYGGIRHKATQTAQKGIPTALFALVYLAVWLAFGVLVYVASIIVDAAVKSTSAVANLLPYALALVLLVAGAYQFSSLKRVCLRVCQSPLGFLMGHWRSGYLGTLKIALEHAVYCIGCCWALMVVLVAAGAMTLPWVLLIATVVFAEKILPHGEWTVRIAGGALVLLGLLVAVQPQLADVLRGAGM